MKMSKTRGLERIIKICRKADSSECYDESLDEKNRVRFLTGTSVQQDVVNTLRLFSMAVKLTVTCKLCSSYFIPSQHLYVSTRTRIKKDSVSSSRF